jgi:hypothetical protein
MNMQISNYTVINYKKYTPKRKILYQVVTSYRHNTTRNKINSFSMKGHHTGKTMFNFTESLLTTGSYSPTSWIIGLLLESKKYKV